MAQTNTGLSGNEIMREVIARSMMALLAKMNQHHKGNANLIMRDIAMLHSNTTFADLPEYLQAEIRALNSAMFGYINREGYVLVPKGDK